MFHVGLLVRQRRAVGIVIPIGTQDARLLSLLENSAQFLRSVAWVFGVELEHL